MDSKFKGNGISLGFSGSAAASRTRKDIRAYYAAFAGAMAAFAHVDAAYVEKLAAELSAE